jgi:hypothetical protein
LWWCCGRRCRSGQRFYRRRRRYCKQDSTSPACCVRAGASGEGAVAATEDCRGCYKSSPALLQEVDVAATEGHRRRYKRPPSLPPTAPELLQAIHRRRCYKGLPSLLQTEQELQAAAIAATNGAGAAARRPSPSPLQMTQELLHAVHRRRRYKRRRRYFKRGAKGLDGGTAAAEFRSVGSVRALVGRIAGNFISLSFANCDESWGPPTWDE